MWIIITTWHVSLTDPAYKKKKKKYGAFYIYCRRSLNHVGGTRRRSYNLTGCCSHIMSIIWYMGWGRYQNNLTPPAQFLDTIIRHDIENEMDEES